MQRKFELAEIIGKDTTDLLRLDSLEAAQQEPHRDEVMYRVISELEVPENPLMEPLVLNVWTQCGKDAEWKLLT